MIFKKGVGKILSFIAEGLILFDKNGSIIFVNPHASLLLDYSAEELTGKHIDKTFGIYINKKQFNKEDSIYNTVFKKLKPFYTPNNSVVYFEANTGKKFPVFISAKQINIDSKDYGIVVFRDITIKKELEDYKINTAKKLAKLTPILQKTATGNFSTNIKIPTREDEFTELFVGINLMLDDLIEMDKTRKKIEGEKIEAIKVIESEKRKLAENYSQKLETEVRIKTDELRRTNEHIETIIENLTVGLIEYDANFTVLKINRTAENILGVKRKDILGRRIEPKDILNQKMISLAKVSYPTLSEKVKKVAPSASGIDREGIGVNEITIHFPLNRDLQVITAPIITTRKESKEGFVKMIRDVTREKIISKSKSEFISIAAHQLRTPLSAIKWAIRLILDGDMGPISQPQLKLLKRGYDTNEKMIILVNDLLNVARIEDGRFGYEFEKNNIVEIISSLIQDASILAKKKNILLEFKKPKEKIKEFTFDSKKISLAIQNLIDNAVKYTQPNGNIVVKINKKGEYVEIQVSDSGVGVPKDQIDRLFSKFFRARNVLRIQTSGSGLGLFIVKNIITRHGGKIHVKSKEGEGSVFYFTLPTKKELIPKEGVIEPA